MEGSIEDWKQERGHTIDITSNYCRFASVSLLLFLVAAMLGRFFFHNSSFGGQDPASGNAHIGRRRPRRRSGIFHRLDDLPPLQHRPKHHVALVQVGSFRRGDEKLRAVRVGPRVGHGEDAGSRVPQLKVLVRKAPTVDGSSPGAIVQDKVSRLQHESGNDAVEFRVLVRQGQTIVVDGVAPTQDFKVLDRFWHHIPVQAEHDASRGFLVNRNVQVGFAGDGRLGWCHGTRRTAITVVIGGQIVGRDEASGPDRRKSQQFSHGLSGTITLIRRWWLVAVMMKRSVAQ